MHCDQYFSSVPLAQELQKQDSKSSANMMAVNFRCQPAPVLKPIVDNHYNHCMNGVDRADQLTVYYSFVRKTSKWWWKVFF